MDKRLRKDFKLDEADLPRLVSWPRTDFTSAEIRKIFAQANRFIDFDGTIAVGGTRMKPSIRGRPVPEFLAEEPFVIQTWNETGAKEFFTSLYPELPQPLLIMLVPAFESVSSVGGNHIGKNFAALRLTGKTIIDDLPFLMIHAPDCQVLHPKL